MSPIRPSRGAPDILFVEGIRFYAHHGATPAEQSVGGWYLVDVELTLDLTPAALSDDLGAAVDYGQVARRVVETGTEQRVSLLERLAGLLCEVLLREFPVHEVMVQVRKLTAPLEGVSAVPGIRMRRTR